MAKSGKKSKEKRIGYNHLGMLGIVLVVLMLLVVLMVKSRSLESTLAVYNARAATLEQEIENEKTRTQDIDEMKEYMLTDEFTEQIAREKLGLVKDNEIVFEEEK